MSFPEDLQVEMTLKLESELYNFPHTEGEFSQGDEMEKLMKKMEQVNQVCRPNAKDCEASFSMTEM